MRIEELAAMLQEMDLPFAYDHFAEGESPEPPFICYLLPGSDNFAADGRVYFRINEVRIELYSDSKDVGLESKVEAVLDSHGIFYNKSEVWIQSEKLYEILYSFEV
ncbi:MAG: hypothetical protein ACI4D3_04645 [Lachnospiraceae bacterium]